jgi:hypothetical protein
MPISALHVTEALNVRLCSYWPEIDWLRGFGSLGACQEILLLIKARMSFEGYITAYLQTALGDFHVTKFPHEIPRTVGPLPTTRRCRLAAEGAGHSAAWV